MLHAGARAYLKASPQERKLREAYFVAIVTPATPAIEENVICLVGKTVIVIGAIRSSLACCS